MFITMIISFKPSLNPFEVRMGYFYPKKHKRDTEMSQLLYAITFGAAVRMFCNHFVDLITFSVSISN